MDKFVSIDFERAAVRDYLVATWEPIDNLEQLITRIQAAAAHAARGWIDPMDVGNACSDLAERRKKAIIAGLCYPTEAERDIAAGYDSAVRILDSLWLESDRVAKAGRNLDGPWDYSERTDTLYKALCAEFPTLSDARPIGWSALEADYSDDEQSDFDSKAACALFKGVDSQSLLDNGFALRVALPNSMYLYKRHGERASYVLVSAIFAHFLKVQEHLNTRSVLTELNSLSLPSTDRIDFDYVLTSSNPILQALCSLCGSKWTQKHLDEALTNYRAYMAMTPEEQAKLASESDARLEELFSKDNMDEACVSQASSVERLTTLLRDLLG